MSEPRQTPDELELKKRARRRLVGAVAFATFAAVVLPMVMDETPPPSGRDIELRIPGQDQLNSSPVTGAKAAAVAKPVVESAVKAPPAPPVATVASAPNLAASAAPSKPAVLEAAAKPATVPEPAKPSPPAKKEAPPDAKRAQAILEGQTADAGGSQVILIGAFANQANVKNLQTKLGQLGIKTYTENLDSPQGRKTRVRAGPFANRDAAEKALEKMRRIGVNGVVAPKQ